jgi:hypothetical protein
MLEIVTVRVLKFFFLFHIHLRRLCSSYTFWDIQIRLVLLFVCYHWKETACFIFQMMFILLHPLCGLQNILLAIQCNEITISMWLAVF